MRDLYHNVLSTQVLNPVVVKTNQTSTTIDLQGFNALCVDFALGLSADTLSGTVYYTLALQQSVDNITYVPLATADANAGVTSIVVNAPTLDRTVYTLGYIGGMRYIQATITVTGTMTNGTPIGIVALRGTPSYRPVVTP